MANQYLFRPKWHNGHCAILVGIGQWPTVILCTGQLPHLIPTASYKKQSAPYIYINHMAAEVQISMNRESQWKHASSTEVNVVIVISGNLVLAISLHGERFMEDRKPVLESFCQNWSGRLYFQRGTIKDACYDKQVHRNDSYT